MDDVDALEELVVVEGVVEFPVGVGFEGLCAFVEALGEGGGFGGEVESHAGPLGALAGEDPEVFDVPFGGRGASGNGSRHGARQSQEEYTQWQWLTVRSAALPQPF